MRRKGERDMKLIRNISIKWKIMLPIIILSFLQSVCPGDEDF